MPPDVHKCSSASGCAGQHALQQPCPGGSQRSQVRCMRDCVRDYVCCVFLFAPNTFMHVTGFVQQAVVSWSDYNLDINWPAWGAPLQQLCMQ